MIEVEWSEKEILVKGDFFDKIASEDRVDISSTIKTLVNEALIKERVIRDINYQVASNFFDSEEVRNSIWEIYSGIEENKRAPFLRKIHKYYKNEVMKMDESPLRKDAYIKFISPYIKEFTGVLYKGEIMTKEQFLKMMRK